MSNSFPLTGKLKKTAAFAPIIPPSIGIYIRTR
jgi:hypothetical protein